MIIREIVVFSSILFLSTYNFAQQNVSISDISTTPHASSVLDVSSSTKGLLIPRVALTAINVSTPIGSTPLTSLLVYNTATAGTAPNNVTPGYYYWDGTKWCRFDTGNNVGDWELLGNAGTNASDNFLGTTDNVDLVFRTNNTEKVRVLSGGNVGIGEINPQRLLHMKGTAGNVALRLENSTAGARTFDIQSTNGGHLHIINQSSSPAYVPFQVNGATNNLGLFNGTPDASASVDITGLEPISGNFNRGLLIPRIALTATNAAAPVTSPATSLLVYNTATAGTAPNNVIPGYYYNSNTPAAPIWRRFATGNGDAWIVGGNNLGTVNASYNLGTISNDHVDFITNNVVRGRISNLGEFFIGGTSTASVGDLMNGVANSAFPWAVNGYTNQNGSGVFGSVTAGASVYAAIEGSYIGTGPGQGVQGNYIGTAASTTTPTGVYGFSNPSVTGNSRIGVHGTYNTAGHWGIGVIGVGAGGGIPTGNFDFAVVGWRSNNSNFSGYFNGNHVIANGTKTASVGTSKGNQLFYVTETPEVWFEDIGSGQLVNGRITIELDPLFLETVLIDENHPMHVFITVNGECNDVYVIPGKTSFEVVEKKSGNSNVRFSYRVMAKRLHFQDHRFGNDPVWGPGDTRKYNSYAQPRPVDYYQGIKMDEEQKNNPPKVNYPETIRMSAAPEIKMKNSKP